jgi:hypothetical protein
VNRQALLHLGRPAPVVPMSLAAVQASLLVQEPEQLL